MGSRVIHLVQGQESCLFWGVFLCINALKSLPPNGEIYHNKSQFSPPNKNHPHFHPVTTRFLSIHGFFLALELATLYLDTAMLPTSVGSTSLKIGHPKETGIPTYSKPSIFRGKKCESQGG